MNPIQESNRLYKALQKGGPTFGAWQTLPGTNHARAVARAGVDWICVDTEHGNIDDGAMHEAVNAIVKEGVSPIVRIAACESWMVKRALDSGAHGIIVPLIYSVDDAKKIVTAAKFPPQGQRGFGSPFATQAFSKTTPGVAGMGEYLMKSNEGLLTIVQIETASALEQVEEIAKIPGIDMLFVGPFDLGNNIGRPILGPMHSELVTAINRIKDAAHAAGKKTGIYCNDGKQAKGYADQGFDMISISTDVIALTTAIAQNVAMASGAKI